MINRKISRHEIIMQMAKLSDRIERGNRSIRDHKREIDTTQKDIDEAEVELLCCKEQLNEEYEK